jgi:hypothetical protein
MSFLWLFHNSLVYNVAHTSFGETGSGSADEDQILFHGIRGLITMFVTANHRSLSSATCSPAHNLTISTLIPSSNLRQGIPSRLFPSSVQTFCGNSHLSHASYIAWPSHFSLISFFLSFFLSYSSLLLPTHYKCGGLLLPWSHSDTRN